MSPLQSTPVKPITPDEVVDAKAAIIPDKVIEVVNEAIAGSWNGYQAIVYQQQVVDALILSGMNRQAIFEQHYLDFESIYRQAGWTVTYDKPGYNESYRPHWIFQVRP